MKKTAIILLILTFLTKIFGFLKVTAINATFGQSLMTDIYNAANTIPVLLIGFITIGLNSALIPVLTEAEKQEKKTEFFNQLLSFLLVVSVVVCVLIFIFATPLSHLVVRNWEQEYILEVAKYSRWMSVLALFQIFTYSFIGYLQQNNRFFIAGTFSIPMNVAIMIAAMMSSKQSLDILVAGTIIGYFIQLVWVYFPYSRYKNAFQFGFDLKNDLFRLLGILILPTVITQSAAQINGIVNKIVASGLPKGSISALTNAQLVTSLFQGVFVMTISIIVFTKQARLSAEQNKTELLRLTRNNISNMLMFIIPMTLGVMFLSTPAMDLLFRRGEFTTQDAVIAGNVLLYYAPIMITGCIIELLSKFFFSVKKTKIPMIASVVTVIINIILNIVIVKYLGVNGLALASTVSTVFGAIVLIVYVRRYYKEQKIRLWTNSFLKYIIAGVVMMGILLILNHWFDLLGMKNYVAIIVVGGLGSIIYFLTLMLLKTEEFFEMLSIVKGRVLSRLIRR